MNNLLPSCTPGLYATDGYPLVATYHAWVNQAMMTAPFGIQKDAQEYLCDAENFLAQKLDLYGCANTLNAPYKGFRAANEGLHRPAFLLGLLCWGLRQPWGKHCNSKGVLLHWREKIDCPTGQNHARAAVLLADYQQLLDNSAKLLPASHRKQMRNQSYALINELVPWKQFSSFEATLLHPAALVLGSIAERYTVRLHDSYMRSMKVAVDTMTKQEQSIWLTTVLDSPLTPSTKRELARHVDPSAWLDEFMPVALSHILDVDERIRFTQLKWSASAAKNSQLCWTFCPHTFDYLSRDVPTFNWSVPLRSNAYLSAPLQQQESPLVVLPDMF